MKKIEHVRTTIELVNGETKYAVEYIGQRPNYKVNVYKNGELFRHFDAKPYTRTENTTKTQAIEIVKIAEKVDENSGL